MKDKILSHFVTIFLNSDNELLDGKMFNEDDSPIIIHHVEAIKNIEKQMNKLRIPYISSEHSELTDVIFDHICHGNIVISNLKSKELPLFIYLPEVLNEKQKNLIINILNILNDCEIHLFKQKGELFYTEHKEEYVKNKQISLTKALQNNKSSKKG